ncbi:MAG: non-hydrolyzing UDP-N-acetylglucosamine 2-epimerase [Gemmatimonadaceae bacterium]
MRILTVVGARPQFIKAAPVSRALRRSHTEILVHTGQHYDEGMSEVFFRELGLPAPDQHLAISGGTHAEMLARMLAGLEPVMRAAVPDAVLLYGDTNSTLAGALAAASIGLPIAHVEAGLRSGDLRMPEERNRILTDRLASLLFCPSDVAVAHLAREGITRGVSVVGDVMRDALDDAVAAAERHSTILARLSLAPQRYVLATIHRAENTDDLSRLAGIVAGLAALDEPVVLPLHPRTRAAMERAGLAWATNVRVQPPLAHHDLTQLLRNARLLVTDSGGLQKEAYWLAVPCVTVRDTTEWVETVEAGWNRLAAPTPTGLVEAVQSAQRPATHPTLYGAPGSVATAIVTALERFAGSLSRSSTSPSSR